MGNKIENVKTVMKVDAEEVALIERLISQYLDEAMECNKAVQEIKLFETRLKVWLQAAGLAGFIALLWVLFA